MNQYNLEYIPRKVEDNIILQRSSDGYVNATAMCQATDKRFNDYTRLKNTQEFFTEFSRSAGIPADLIVQIINTGKNEQRGTWVHPDVAIHLAQWCSPQFAVKVNQFVREWLQGTTPEQEKMKSWQNFHDRVDLTKNSVPVGYFSIFHEIASMIVPMIDSGVAINEHTIPDISVGITWSNYWVAEKLDLSYDRKHYPHNYPEYYPQAQGGAKDSWCYNEEALPIFRKWFRDIYQLSKLPNYLNNKQSKGHIDSETRNILIDKFNPKVIK